MKKVNIAYWIVTILFAGFMLFSGIMNAIMEPNGVKLMHEVLGYPVYIVPFIGWAKVVGAIIILIPGFPRLKEWAYAGLFIDLAGAAYSNVQTEGMASLAFMLIFFAFFFASYFLYHKRMKMKGQATV